MQKRQFIDRVAAKTGLTKKDNARVMDAVFETLGEILVQGDRLVVSGFGAFNTVHRAGRRARNPQTGSSVAVPPGKTAVFRPSPAFRERLNSSTQRERSQTRT